MKLLFALAVVGYASASTTGGTVSRVCRVLKDKFPDKTIFRNERLFLNETQVPWSTVAWREPACIFTPAKANDLSFAVRQLAKHRTKFAFRGGGHMPITGANSIDSTGVLISSTNLNTLKLSDDKNTFWIGSGPRWGDAFEMLDGTGVSVVGARLGTVGVPGLLLGGGISFYSYEHGLASTNDNIKSYECVLANGTIAQVTSSNKYSDLHWALQAGGSSYCLVTKFELRTVEALSTMFGSPVYGGSEVAVKFMDSVYNFAWNGHLDPKAAIIPVVRWIVGTDPNYSTTLFYNGDNASPEVFDDFLGGYITPLDVSTALVPYSLGQFNKQVGPQFKPGGLSYGSRQRFHLLPMLANREAMQQVHDLYFEEAMKKFSASTGTIIGMAFNPITKHMLAATNAKPGPLQGLDETPCFWIEQTYSWKDAADDILIEEFIQSYNHKALEILKEFNATDTFYYMNEADAGQPVFESYPAGSLERLKDIRSKYDPSKVFTDLMPGPFKVADV